MRAGRSGAAARREAPSNVVDEIERSGAELEGTTGNTGRMLPLRDFFHVGIRVADIDRAMGEIGTASDLTWCPVQDRPMSVWTPQDGAVVIPLKLTYSVEGPVHLELLEGPAGTVWDGRDQPGAHHFGYWCDDVGAETRSLIAQGWTVELAAGPPEAGYGRFSYVRSPEGFLVEPVASASRYRFERWWAGGLLNDPSQDC